MAFETITIATLLTQMARKVCNSDTLDPTLATEAQFALHAAYRDLIRESHAERVMGAAGTAITLVSGTAVYGLDDDAFMLVEESLRLTSSPWTTLRPMTRQQYDNLEVTSQQATGYPERYVMEGASSSTGKHQIRLYPTPNSAANGKTLSYFKIATLTSLLGVATSTTLDQRMPPEWHHFLVVGALRWMKQYLDESDWAAYNSMWQQYLLDARRTAWPQTGWSEQREAYRPGDYYARQFAPLSSWPLSP